MLSKSYKVLTRLRNRHLLMIDTIIFCLIPIATLAIRLDGAIPFNVYGLDFLWIIFFFLSLKIFVLRVSGFYKCYWRYASIGDLQQIVILATIATALQTALFSVFYQTESFSADFLPRSFPVLDGILSFLLVGTVRFSIRAITQWHASQRKVYRRRDRVLIVGAGSAGADLAQEMRRHPELGFRPVAFIDDDSAKISLKIHQIPVVGNRYYIPEFVRTLHIRKIVIAMPSVPGGVIREILEICQLAGVPTKTLPGIDTILNGRVSLGQLREVQIEDLLRREPVQMDAEPVTNLIKGRRVLITGAGGSIGSELCRQVLKCRPAELILVGHGENSIFQIQQELEKALQVFQEDGKIEDEIPHLKTFIADVRFLSRIEYAFKQFRPDIIFHAAAHKHVPMMELNPVEAITTNVQGTKNLIDLAVKYDVEHFVMVSTDKAVNPRNVMGASKRVAEMLVLQAAQTNKKSFVVVRFGNVLGSRGSVIPTFKRQIAEGGPITVTHPEICRYFMTIPEAVQLLLQAAVLGKGGEVFILDMGKPVKIVDLAKELIHLSGYELGKHIDIVFTGLRPGEKLYEDLFLADEKYDQTQHEKLFVAETASRIVSGKLSAKLPALIRAAEENDANLVLSLLQQLVPEYIPQDFVIPAPTKNMKTESVSQFTTSIDLAECS